MLPVWKYWKLRPDKCSSHRGAVFFDFSLEASQSNVHEQTFKRLLRDFWETFERLLRDFWKTFERLLRDFWETFERLLRDFWETFERQRQRQRQRQKSDLDSIRNSCDVLECRMLGNFAITKSNPIDRGKGKVNLSIPTPSFSSPHWQVSDTHVESNLRLTFPSLTKLWHWPRFKI